jgi:transposase
MQGRKIYQEKLFTQVQLSELVPEENFYRQLRNILDMQWLYKATAKYYGTEGQVSIDPVVFFKLILIGYLENQPSDRRIMSMVSMRLDMLYFIGYDIGEPLPWHSTLSRTRQLYGEEEFRQLFREILKQCIEKGMVTGRRQAVDSALIKANASMESIVEREILEDADDYTKSLRQEEQPVKSKQFKGVRIRKSQTHYSTTDPEARLATKPGKPTQLNYLAQVSVDTAGYIITNIEAHSADKRDSECLAEVVTNTINNLQSEGLTVKEILADTGYSSGEALKYLEDNNITGYIPNLGQYKPDRKEFTYDKENDQYLCSRGAKIVFKKIERSTDGHYNKIYSSSRKDCNTCPLRTKCIGKSKLKKIYQSTAKPFYDRMYQRMCGPEAKRMRKLRQTTVEPVLGTLINFSGMKKMNTRGLRLATKCMIMAAIAYNLKKLLKYSLSKLEADVKAIALLKKSCLKMLYYSYVALLHVIESKRLKANLSLK